jgi:hypothetical protein
MARCLDQRGGGRVLAFAPAQDSAAKLRGAAVLHQQPKKSLNASAPIRDR